MSNPTFATEQLLELMLQLKKTTPDAARQILNSQPQIAYALMTLMVNMNAVNIQVFQKTLADFASKTVAPSSAAAPPPAAPSVPTAQPQPVPYVSANPAPQASAIPPHLQSQYQQPYRVTPPPSAPPSAPPPAAPAAPSYTNGYGGSAQQYPGYGQPQSQGGYYGQQAQQQPQQPSQYPGYGYPQTAPNAGYGVPPASSALSALPPNIRETLAAMPEEQRALLIRVVSMTPEQIYALPPSERQTHIQLRATLGIPT